MNARNGLFVIVLSFVLFLPLQFDTIDANETRISITPSIPTVADMIRTNVSGISNTSCTPKYESHQRVANIITINTRSPVGPGILCQQAFTPWKFTVEIGRLPLGVYTVEVVGAEQITTSFEVKEAQIFLPLVFNSATGALTFENYTRNPIIIKLIGYGSRTFSASLGPHAWNDIPRGVYQWEATGTCNGVQGTVGSTQTGNNFRAPITIITNQIVPLNAERGGKFTCG